MCIYGYIYIYVCVHVCVYIRCVYAYSHVCICVYTCVSACVYTCIYIYTHIHGNVNLCIYTSIHAIMCTCVCIYIHMYLELRARAPIRTLDWAGTWPHSEDWSHMRALTRQPRSPQQSREGAKWRLFLQVVGGGPFPGNPSETRVLRLWVYTVAPDFWKLPSSKTISPSQYQAFSG